MSSGQVEQAVPEPNQFEQAHMRIDEAIARVDSQTARVRRAADILFGANPMAEAPNASISGTNSEVVVGLGETLNNRASVLAMAISDLEVELNRMDQL